MSRIKLFCLPYAGSSAMLYIKWKKLLDPSIELYPLELAGRGKRFSAPLYSTFEEAVDDVFRLMNKEIDENPYAIFGHSLGGLIAYEVCHKLSGLSYPNPQHVFFSGIQAPQHVNQKDKLLHELPEAEFKVEILKLEGTPKEVFESSELAELFIPIIRADYTIYETYRYREKNNKLTYPITAMGGKRDTITIPEITDWQDHTENEFKMYLFEGGHFFIHEDLENTIKLINRILVDNYQSVTLNFC